MILETPPYFFPEHAEAAVEAGLHVYMAKPVAVDVPGTLQDRRAGQGGRGRRSGSSWSITRCPPIPSTSKSASDFREGGLGKLQMVFSVGTSGGGGVQRSAARPTRSKAA